MELYYIMCNASGNTTALIKSPLSRELYVTAAIIIREKLGIEQVGFLEKKVSGNYHLEMMGGEFCGNASRSLAACMALGFFEEDSSRNFQGEQVQSIDTSGCKSELVAMVKYLGSGDCCYVEMDMPCPLNLIHGRNKVLDSYSMLLFDGIVHVILWEGEASEKRVFQVKNFLEEQLISVDCFGVMFYQESKQWMQPAVYLNSTKSLVWEGSCGSGTAAVAIALSHRSGHDIVHHVIHQPGGDLEASAIWLDNGMQVSLGGKVKVVEKGMVQICVK